MKKILLLIVIGMVLYGCKKSEIGPQGPQGVQGQAGANGNANLSTTLVTITNWRQESSTSNQYSVTIGVSSITNAVLTGGIIQVSFSYDNGDTWTVLPASFGPEYHLQYFESVGKVDLLWTCNDTKKIDSPYNYFGPMRVKITVFPPL